MESDDAPVRLPSRPAQVTVHASPSQRDITHHRSGSTESLPRTLDFYGVSHPSSTSLGRRTSLERRPAPLVSSPSSPPPAPRDPDRYVESARPSSSQPSAHSANILPSASFFNPQRPGRVVGAGPSAVSPALSRSPTPTYETTRFSNLLGLRSPSFDSGHQKRKGNGPIITRVASEYSTHSGEQLLTRRLSDELDDEAALRRLSHLPGSTDVLPPPSLRSPRPTSPDFVPGPALGTLRVTSPSTSSLAVRTSSETQARGPSIISSKESREPLIDFPNTATRVDASTSPRRHKTSGEDELRLTSTISVEGVVQRARNSFSMSRAHQGLYQKPPLGSQLLPGELPATAPAPAEPAVIHVTPVTNDKGRRVRNYELHEGSNRFLLHGRLMSSKDNPTPFIISLLIAVVLPLLFLAFSGPFLWDHLGGGGKASIFVFVYLYLVMLVNMCSAALRDPGIIPRALDKMPQRKWVDDLYGEGKGGWRAEPKYMRMREGVVASKWCETCGTYRPPRTSHCRLCDNCVEHTDHHCTFLNNCIARRNYTPFFAFLVTSILCSVYAISFSAWHIATRHSEDPSGSWASRWDVIGSIVVAVLAFGFLCPILGLLGYHARLLWTNRTTIEMLRPKGDRSGGINPADGTATGNLYALQSPFANMVSLLCRPMDVPSWIAASSYATQDAREDFEHAGGKEEV